MNKRIMAWLLLIGFTALLLNIIVFGYQRMLSIFVYIVIAAVFLAIMNKKKNQ